MSLDYLLKTEPSEYSFADLQRDKVTVWDGVSNPTAVKNLREMQPGARLIIYETGDRKSAVGTATVVSIDASDSSGNPLAVGMSLAGSLMPNSPFDVGGSSGRLIGDSTNSGSSFAPLTFSPDISSGAALISSAAAQGNSVPEPSTIALTVLAPLVATASVARRVRREVARRR